MSIAYVTQAAQVDMMQDILREPCTIRLYVNDVGPEPTASDFLEPDGGGYSPKPVRSQSWDLGRAPQEATYPKQTWTFDGPLGGEEKQVRGWYITRNSDGRLRYFAPLSGGPQRVMNDGDQISVTVTLSLADDAEEEPSSGETP